MARQSKIQPFALVIFVLTLSPIAATLGVFSCGIALAARMPFADAAFDASMYVIGFLVTATIGHTVATKLCPAARSKLITGRSWRFPVACGIAVSAAATLVEPTLDFLGRVHGHRNENLVAAGCVIFYSAMATAVVLGIDSLIFRQSAKRSND
jgi:hypothetical protein